MELRPLLPHSATHAESLDSVSTAVSTTAHNPGSLERVLHWHESQTVFVIIVVITLSSCLQFLL